MITCGIIFIKKNKTFDLMSMFCFLWAMVFLGASLRLFGMVKYSNFTVWIYLVSSLSFVVAAYLSRFSNCKNKRSGTK